MRLRASVFLLSVSALSFEIIIIRILAQTHWRPFVTLAVSTALLGYGLAGSVLMYSGGRAFQYRHIVYPLASVLAAGSFRPATWAAAALHLEPGLIFREPTQWIFLAGLVAILTVPFTLVSICLALPFLEKSTVGEYYGWNLAGACGGVALASIGMILLAPEQITLIPTAAAAMGSLLAMAHYKSGGLWFWTTAVFFTVMITVPGGTLRYGPYKDISYSLLLPEASISTRYWGPGGLLEVVRAPSLRTAPGLSTRFKGTIPNQAVLYRDGDRVGTLVLTDKSGLASDYPMWQTSASPYTVVDKPDKVVVLGFEGGEEIRRAIAANVPLVEIVEADGAAAAMIKKVQGPGNGSVGLPDRYHMVVDHPRRYLATHGADTDIVVIPLTENLASSVAGFGAASENYVLTAEGISAALGILKPGGVLAITGWNQSPPSGRMKLIRTLMEHPGLSPDRVLTGYVRLVEGWSTYTALIGREKLAEDRLKKLERFCERCGFNLLDPAQFTSSFPGSGKTSYMAGLDLGPVTDERPYPWHSLRMSLLLKALGNRREEVLPRMEWGFLFLSMTLLTTFVAAFGLLLLTRPRTAGKTAVPALLYFTSLGLGYMAVEILAIKRGGLLIAQPASAAAFVLAPFLLFSGIGSFAVIKVENWFFKGRWVYIAIPIGGFLLYLLLPILIPFPAAVGTILFITMICPLACAMGLPFPLGLRRESHLRQVSVPWVWAVSGYSSAVGSALAGVLCVTMGLRTLVAVAAVCYLAAGLLLGRLGENGSD